MSLYLAQGGLRILDSISKNFSGLNHFNIVTEKTDVSVCSKKVFGISDKGLGYVIVQW